MITRVMTPVNGLEVLMPVLGKKNDDCGYDLQVLSGGNERIRGKFSGYAGRWCMVSADKGACRRIGITRELKGACRIYEFSPYYLY